MNKNKNFKTCCDLFQGAYIFENNRGIKSFKWLNSKGHLDVVNGYHYTTIYKKLKNYINDNGTIKGYTLSELKTLNIKIKNMED